MAGGVKRIEEPFQERGEKLVVMKRK